MAGRSLGTTLVASASTFAVFSVANWDASHLTGFWQRLLDHALVAIGFPLMALSKSLVRALAVRTMKRTLSASKVEVDHETVAIMTGCPIFIQTPHVAQLNYVGTCFSPRDRDMVKRLCPLELVAQQGSAAGGSGNTLTQAEPLYVQLDWYEPMATNLWQDLFASFYKPMVYLWTVKDYEKFTGEMKARLALLALSLVPEAGELSILPSRSRFQSLVSGLQASGYVLGVVERLWQHLAISPMEAMVCFFSFLVALQLFIELYASGNFQRPLLLHLTADQFDSLQKALTGSGGTASSDHTSDAPSSIIAQTDFNSSALQWDFPFFCLASFVFLIPSMWYYLHFRHAAPLSSLCVLLFSLAPCVVAIVQIIYDLGGKDQYKTVLQLRALSFIIQYFMYAGGIILGVVSTVRAWPLFDTVAHTWYAWLLPHVSD